MNGLWRAWRVSGRVHVDNARQAWTERAGVLVSQSSQGLVGWGEASPLPGWSQEDPGDVLDALARWRQGDASVESPASWTFARETALLDLEAKERGWPADQTLAARWGGRPRAELATARLVDLEGAVDGWGYLTQEQAASPLKVKIGRAGRFEEEVEQLRRLREVIGPTRPLRLDANQGLDPDRLDEELAILAELEPEFLEEPVAWNNWPGSTPIPLALDETLVRDGRAWGEEDLLELLGPLVDAGTLACLVLKPMLLGGIGRCFELARAAQGLGLGLVVSHLFDGPVALAAASALALALPGDVWPAGLAPHGGLAAWPGADTPWYASGKIRAPQPSLPGLGIDPSRWALGSEAS